MSVLSHWLVLVLLNACRREAPLAVPVEAPVVPTVRPVDPVTARKRSMSVSAATAAAVDAQTAGTSSHPTDEIALLITSDELARLQRKAEDDANNNEIATPNQLLDEILRSAPIELLAKHLVMRATDIEMDLLRQRMIAMSDPATLVLVSTIGAAFDDVLRLLIGHRQYVKATQVLTAYCRTSEFAHLWYQHSTALMMNAPVSFVRKGLIPLHNDVGIHAMQLLPALLAYSPACNERPSEDDFVELAANARRAGTSRSVLLAQIPDNVAVEYLAFLIYKCDNTDEAIHHLYVQKLVAEENDDDLVQFIQSSKWYDHSLVFRMCLGGRRYKPCVDLFLKLGMPTDAVKLALAIDEVGLAKDRVNRIKAGSLPSSSGHNGALATPEEVALLRSNLWRMISQHVLTREGGAKNALLLLNESSDINVSDVLPHFNQHVMLCEFRNELLGGVATFARQMTRTKENIESRQIIIGQLREQVQTVAQAKMSMSVAKRCAVCQNAALTKAFVTFPHCGHAFHVTCFNKARQEIAAQQSPSAGALGRSPARPQSTHDHHSTCIMCASSSLHALLSGTLTGASSSHSVALDL